MNESLVVGVDVGGSHITVAIVDLEAKKVLPHTFKRSAVDSQGSSDAIFNRWCDTIHASIKELAVPVNLIGIAMPGPVDYEEGTCFIKGQNKYDALYGLNLKDRISMRLGVSRSSLYMSNDAACYIQGEADCGAGMGYDRVLGFTLGTGFGSSVYADGFAADADLWHSPFRDSIAEDYFSTRWFVKRCEVLFGKKLSNVKEIVESMRGTEALTQLFNEFGSNFGAFLTTHIKQAKPGMIVLGGNIAATFDYFHTTLKETLKAYNTDVAITTSSLGENAALIGAASFAHRKHAAVTEAAQIS